MSNTNFSALKARFQAPKQEEEKLTLFEGSVVKLVAGQTNPSGGGDKSAEFTLKDESKGAPEKRPYQLDDPPINYTLPDVPDDKANYKFSYAFKHTASKTEASSRVRTVWPKTLKLTAKYTKKPGDTTSFTDNQLVEGFEFKIVQGETVSQKWTTDPSGYAAPPLPDTVPARVVAVTPWVIESPTDQSKSPRKRELKVYKQSWVAKIRSHLGRGKTEGAPVKQYVNLDKNYSADEGPLLKLLLGPEDITTAVTGQEVKVRVTFNEKNSKCKSPRPAVWTGETASTALKPTKGGDPGTATVVFETVVQIPADGQPAPLYVQMGVSGGDKCKIEVGVTDAYEDDKVFIETWRKLRLQMVQPTADTITSYTVFKADKSVGMSSAQETLLKDEFKRFYTEFEFFDPRAFTPDDVGDATKQKCRILDAKEVGLTAGKKVVLLNWDDYWRIAHLYRPTDPRTWCTVWADFWHDPGPDKVLSYEFASLSQTWTQPLGAPEAAFKFDPDKADGTLGIKKITWKATQYNAGAGWKPFVTGDATLENALGAAEVARLSGSNEITPDEAEQDLWVEFLNYRSIKFKLPNRPADFKAGVKYSVAFELRTSQFGTNAGAAVGLVGMSTMCTFKDEGLIATLAHELGHNMGQGYGMAVSGLALIPSAGNLRTTFGGRSAEIPGVPFPQQVPNGDFYTGRGHTGAHCAHGLSKNQKFDLNYQEKGYNGDCIMFGSGDMNSSTKKVFCATCIGYMKATDMADITRQW